MEEEGAEAPGEDFVRGMLMVLVLVMGDMRVVEVYMRMIGLA